MQVNLGRALGPTELTPGWTSSNMPAATGSNSCVREVHEGIKPSNTLDYPFTARRQYQEPLHRLSDWVAVKCRNQPKILPQ